MLIKGATTPGTTPITSDLRFDQWSPFLPEHTTAVSILDRLMHHASVVVTDGWSHRMRDAAATERSTPRPTKPEIHAKGGTYNWPPTGTPTWP
jgi:IstB-like ATP binding protein